MRMAALPRLVRGSNLSDALRHAWGGRLVHSRWSFVSCTGTDFINDREGSFQPDLAVSHPNYARDEERTLRTAYSHLLSQSRLKEDPTQVAALEALDSLLAQIRQVSNHADHADHSAKAQASLESGSMQSASSPRPLHAADTATTLDLPKDDLQHAAARGSNGGLPGICGVYLWGSVGSGKTMLMDLLAAATASSVQSVEPGTELKAPRMLRVHFHEFMLTVHSRMHELQQALPRRVTESRDGLPVYRYAALPASPVEVVALSLVNQVDLLLLDELHVTDVADALILSQLLNIVLSSGTYVVFTSNQPPQDLYAKGMNRKYFMPFIESIERCFTICHVGQGIDYRLGQPSVSAADSSMIGSGKLAGENVKGSWLCEHDAAEVLAKTWNSRAVCKEYPLDIKVGFGRTIHVPRVLPVPADERQAGGHAAFFTFEQGFVCLRHIMSSSLEWGLCRVHWPPPGVIRPSLPPLVSGAKDVVVALTLVCGHHGLMRGLDDGGALGPADLLSLAKAFSTIYLTGVPELTRKQRDEGRRLVTFLDAAYEERCQLFVAAQGTPLEVFHGLIAADILEEEDAKNMPRRPSEPARSAPQEVSEEEALMYRRAVSRLIEMCQLS